MCDELIANNWQGGIAVAVLLVTSIAIVCSARPWRDAETEMLAKLADEWERAVALATKGIRDRDALIREQEAEIAELRGLLKEARKHLPVKAIKEYRN